MDATWALQCGLYNADTTTDSSNSGMLQLRRHKKEVRSEKTSLDKPVQDITAGEVHEKHSQSHPTDTVIRFWSNGFWLRNYKNLSVVRKGQYLHSSHEEASNYANAICTQ